jgi:hypothetical protein
VTRCGEGDFHPPDQIQTGGTNIRSRKLTGQNEFVPMCGVKFLLPLALIAAITFTSCTTLANRRDLYSPAKGSGPYTQKLKKMNSAKSRTTKIAKPRKSAE